MKPIVIYHDNCTDGFGAAFAARTALGNNAEYEPMSYNQHDDVPTYLDTKYGGLDRVIYILDFSIPKDQTMRLISESKRLVWLDHHKTAFEMWHPTERTKLIQGEVMDQINPVCCEILLDNNKSGAMLAWEHFHPGQPVPLLIHRIDDRDRWQFKLAGSKAQHIALQSEKPWNFDQWRLLLDIEQLATLEDKGWALLNYQEQQVKHAAHSPAKVRIAPWFIDSELFNSRPWQRSEANVCYVDGLATNTPVHMSEVGHELANASGTFGMVWYIHNSDPTIARVSLRSNGDYDVSAIAKAFGGGGHKNAAGFNIDVHTLLGWLTYDK
jgi:uncharacterized protein